MIGEKKREEEEKEENDKGIVSQSNPAPYCHLLSFCLFICLLLLFCCQYWDGDKQGWGEKKLHWHTLHPYTTPVPWVSSHTLHADRGESVSDRGDPAAAPPSPPQHLSVTLMVVTRLPMHCPALACHETAMSTSMEWCWEWEFHKVNAFMHLFLWEWNQNWPCLLFFCLLS